MAARTPESRNRYVDFLRAVSILVVVTGHWLIAGFHYVDGSIRFTDVLEMQPGTQWMTWIFQVMPIFFIVGGYANAVSLESARRRELDYAAWLASRLHRLVTPLLALLIGWAGFAICLRVWGIGGDVIAQGSRAALIPIWFLAIYIMVVVLAPAAYAAWRRWGFVSFWALVAVAAIVDTLFFYANVRLPGWSNYFWVWLAVHHLGFAWRDDRLGGPGRLLLYAAIAFVVLFLMVDPGPYPLAMVGSPDEISNSRPPKLALLVLGVIQLGVLLSIQAPMRRILSGLRVWAATVLINSMIMTLYLWHLTVMIIMVALLFLAGGVGLELEPSSAEWWLARPIWILVLYLVLLPVTLALSAFERRTRSADALVPSAWRLVMGAIMICLGVAMLALYGFGTTPVPEVDVVAFLSVLAGAFLSGLILQRKP